MKLTSLFAGILFISINVLSFSKNAPGKNLPKPGSIRVVTKKIEYISGNIEGSSGKATWPVAIFEADADAVGYSVKVMQTGKTYSWNAGGSTQSEYHVFPSFNDIKNGKFYVALGRTWCNECGNNDVAWEDNYRNNVFSENNKVEITFSY